MMTLPAITIESIRWPDGIVCPKCGCKVQRQFSTIAPNPEEKVRSGLRYCAECNSQFTVTIGTIFEDSHTCFQISSGFRFL